MIPSNEDQVVVNGEGSRMTAQEEATIEQIKTLIATLLGDGYAHAQCWLTDTHVFDRKRIKLNDDNDGEEEKNKDKEEDNNGNKEGKNNEEVEAEQQQNKPSHVFPPIDDNDKSKLSSQIGSLYA